MDSPIENHLYSVSYDSESDRPISRLSRENHHHTSVYISLSCNIFVSIFSSVESPILCEVYRLPFSRPNTSSSTDSTSTVSRHPIDAVF